MGMMVLMVASWPAERRDAAMAMPLKAATVVPGGRGRGEVLDMVDVACSFHFRTLMQFDT